MRRLALVLVVLLGGCVSSSATTIQPRDGRSGLHGAGTLDGRQVAVAQGLPELVVGNCDPIDGADDDVCIISDTIDGRVFVLNFENPALLEAGADLPVAATDCASPSACDDASEAAIVSVKLGTDAAVRATGGRLQIERVEPFANYVGEVSLELPNGRFTGSFDVVPRPD
jgi:hypothetical protein